MAFTMLFRSILMIVAVGTVVVGETVQSQPQRVALPKRCLAIINPMKEGAKEMERQLTQCRSLHKMEKSALDELHLEYESYKHEKEKTVLDLTNELKHAQEMIKALKTQLGDKFAAEGLEQEVSQLKSSLAETEAQLSLSSEKVKKFDKMTKLNKELKLNNTQLVRLGKSLRKKANAFERDAEDAWRSLELEKQLSTRLENLISTSNIGVNAALPSNDDGKKDELIKTLEHKVEKLTADLESQVKDEAAEIENSEKLSEVETKLEKCNDEVDTLRLVIEEKNEISGKLEESERDLTNANEKLRAVEASLGEVQKLNEEMETSVNKAVENFKNCEDRSAEMEGLFEEYQKKMEDPALVDYLEKKMEWLQNPQVEGVTIAYDKTVKLFGPRLNMTIDKVAQMKYFLDASSEILSSAVGKPEYTPLVAGLLTYGILLVPFGFSVCMLVRVKRSITLRKLTVWMSLYLCLFSLVALGLSKLVKLEPMMALRQHNESAYEFLQLGIAMFASAYFLCVYLYTFGQVTFEGRCSFSIRHIFQFLVPAVLGSHYYYHVWLLAMKDKDPDLDPRYWAAYAGGFFLLFLLFTLFTKSNVRIDQNSMNKKPVLPVTAVSVEPTIDQQIVEDDFVMPIVKEKKSKKSKKKKHKHGHRVAEALDDATPLMEFEAVEPEVLVEEVETIAEAATTGEAIDDIKKRKAEKKRKKKAKYKNTENYESDDLENAKVD